MGCNQNGRPMLYLVRNYRRPESIDEQHIRKGEVATGSFGKWSLRDAKAATAAAPTYVESRRRKDDQSDAAFYVDGALYACNPTATAILEAKHMWPGRKIGAVHSFGVGRSRGLTRHTSADDNDKFLWD